MKKIYTFGLILFTSIFSFAQIIDTFGGTGALTANGWVNKSGTANQLTISAGSLIFPGLTGGGGNKVALVSGNTEDVDRVLPSAITTTAYYSAVLNLPNATGLTTGGDYSLSLSAGTILVARLFIRLGSAANTFNIGAVNSSGGASTVLYFSTDYAINVPLFIVMKYTLATNSASLFINPAFNTTEPVAILTSASGTTVPAQITNITIRQGTAATGNVEFDDIRVADNWTYVTSSTLSNSKNEIAGLSIYPNPAKDGKLFITSNANENKQVLIFDLLGKQVLKTNISTEAVNISSLTSGAYFVKVTENGKIATRKLLIQ